jgi:hypothetical protein
MELGLEGLGVLSVPHVFFHQDITMSSRQPLVKESQGDSRTWRLQPLGGEMGPRIGSSTLGKGQDLGDLNTNTHIPTLYSHSFVVLRFDLRASYFS